MGLRNIGNNVSGSDVEKIRNRGNHGEFADGFGPEDSDGLDDDLDINFDFGDLDLGGGGTSGDNGAGTSYNFGAYNQNNNNNNGGGIGGFGNDSMNSGNGIGLGSNPFSYNNNQQQQPQNTGPDVMDTVIEKSKSAGFAFAHIIRDTVKSIKSKKASDWGNYFRNLIIMSFIVIGVGLILGIIGTVAGLDKLTFKSVPSDFILTGIVLIGLAMPGLAFAAKANVGNMVKPKPVPAVTPAENNSFLDDLGLSGDDFDEDELYGDYTDDDYDDDISDSGNEIDTGNLVLDSVELEAPEEVNFNKALESVQERVPLLSRAYLVDTFKGFFGCCTPQFSEKKVIAPGTDDFAQLEAICIKSLAAAAKKEVDELSSCKLESAEETFFTYELKVTRYKSLTKVEDIEKEITAYTRTSPDDSSISTSVAILGDFYIIKIFKGVKAIITLGDIFKKQETIDFFKDEKNKLPYIVGIKSDGSVLYRDAKKIESMLIVGRPRYGKSWFVINILANLTLFNRPEDVQVIIVDPKKTTMFRSISMMPHVAGFHDDSNILDLLRDLIYVEGERRIKLLLDNKCDTIWDLRDRKGIKLPILYFFMDEVISIKNNLDKEGCATFDEYTKTIITKFPYIGIRIIMISHRAQGVIDKTVREQIGFRAAVGATEEVITEALGVKRFGTALETPGEAALSISDLAPTYIRGNAIMASDNDNVEFFKNAARAFYKMGFDAADCSGLGCCYNRNEKEIQSELLGDKGEHIQLDF